MENKKSQKPDDQKITAFSQQARNLPIPENLRQSNLAAIKAALDASETQRNTAPAWWRKRIAIPLPLAAAVLLVLLLQMTLSVLVFTRESGAHTLSPINPTGLSKTVAPPQYSETCVYVSGMGVVNKNQVFFHEEN
jgi:hypothetical protein